MKVLHVLPSLALEWGGPVQVVRGLTEALRNKGVKTSVFSTIGRRVGKCPVSLATAEVHLFRTSRLAWLWTAHASGLGAALQRAVSEFDLVHIHELWHYPHFAAYQAAMKAQKYYVLTVHGQLDPWALRYKGFRKSCFMALIERWILKHASALQAITEEEARQIRARGLEVPVAVIPNGINPGEFEDLPSRLEFEEHYPGLQGKKVMLFLGRLHPIKGLDFLARAFGAIGRERDDVRLVIAGPEERGYRAQVESVLESEGVLAKTYFTGVLLRRKKLAALSRADIVVIPSHSEVHSIVALEAMICRCPLVITRQCEFAEIAEANAGIVIDADDKQLAGALVKVLDNAEMRERMGENGRRLVLERFTWDKVADRMMGLYRDVLES